MNPAECRDKVRLSVSDETGVMRVKHFNILDAPGCREYTEHVRSLLVDRPLRDINPDEIRRIPCSGEGICGNAVADIITEYQKLIGQEEQPAAKKSTIR